MHQAKSAIDALNGSTLLERKISVDWAFKKPSGRTAGGGGGGGGGRREVRGRDRRRRSADRD